jgi:8-oxo-dGTP pyrophosphatase MutT (NUDIX family)
MSFATNPFGDISILYAEGQTFPEINYEIQNHVLISQAPADFFHPHLKYFIGKTTAHGNIFGNRHALHRFPIIVDGMLSAACSVVLAKFEGESYGVLVQVQNRNYVMNPAGYHDVSDESVEAAGMREVWEETGLKVDPSNYKKHAQWKDKVKFGGLAFEVQISCGVCFVENLSPICPSLVIDGNDVIKIPVGSSEIESVLLIKVSALLNFQKLSNNKTIPTEFSRHHFNVLLQAAIDEGLLDASSVFQPIPYLRDFSFV